MGLEIKEYNAKINNGDYVLLKFDFVDKDGDTLPQGIYKTGFVDKESMLLFDPLTGDSEVIIFTEQQEEYIEKILDFAVVTDNNTASWNDIGSVGIILKSDLENIYYDEQRVMTRTKQHRYNSCYTINDDMRTANKDEINRCIECWNKGTTYHTDITTEDDKDIEFKREFKRRYGSGAVICYVDDDYNIITETI